MEGKCLTKSVIYKVTVTYNNKKLFYIGSTARSFKTRYYEHMHSFRNNNLKESTKLISFVHTSKFNKNMIKNNKLTTIKWNIMHKINQRKPSRICTLCNIERLEIAFAHKKTSLNSRTELVGKCRHFSKFYLKSYFCRAYLLVL